MPFDMHRKRRHSPDDMTYVEPRLFFDGLILSKNKEQKIDDQMIRMALVFGGERRGELLPSSSVLFSS